MKKILITIFVLLLMSFKCPASSTFWDYDGDGRTDLVVIRPEGDFINGYASRWYILQSRDGFYSIQWGGYDPRACSSFPVPGDFDGDGKTDIASAGRCLDGGQMYYYILNSSDNRLRVVQWGSNTDREMLEDFDGDGKTDFGVYRSGWWYILNSRDSSFRAEQFGTADNTFGDKPVYGDYDGDGKADLAVARMNNSFSLPSPVTLIVKQSGSGNWFSYSMGERRGDYVVPGDYDGDGKTDFALYGGRDEYGDGRFRVIRSSDGAFVSVRFGSPGYYDRPIPGDYDGDGKTDFAVYRQGTPNNPQHYFYIMGSRSGFQAIPWGSYGYSDFTPMIRQLSWQ